MKTAKTYQNIGWITVVGGKNFGKSHPVYRERCYAMDCFVVTTTDNEEIIAFIETNNVNHYYNLAEFEETRESVSLNHLEEKNVITIRKSEQDYWNKVANWRYQ
ncbi:hypothetical protein ACYSNR_15015 [Enterococcus sp. LJL128]